jgi:hypothetical protein
MYEWMKRDDIPARAPSGSAAALSYLRGNPRWPVVTGTLGGRHLGAIAQLEERLVCIQKARGSSPLSSTGQRPNAILKASKQSQTKSQTRPATVPVIATLRAVGTAKVRSSGMRRTAPGSVLSRSAGARTGRGSGGRSPGAPRRRPALGPARWPAAQSAPSPPRLPRAHRPGCHGLQRLPRPLG